MWMLDFSAEQSCLWRHCGFCSVDVPEELRRHVFFHCYHTKLKQLGLQVLTSNPNMGTCSIGYQNRNIVPEIPDNFTCLWEDCEVHFMVQIYSFYFLRGYSRKSTWIQKCLQSIIIVILVIDPLCVCSNPPMKTLNGFTDTWSCTVSVWTSPPVTVNACYAVRGKVRRQGLIPCADVRRCYSLSW